MKPPFLPFDEPNLCNDYISMDPEYSYQSVFLNQTDSNIDLLDNVLLTKVVLRPTEKPRSVGPHESKSEKTRNKKKSRLKNKKFRSGNMNYVEDLYNQVVIERTYYHKVYSTQTEI